MRGGRYSNSHCQVVGRNRHFKESVEEVDERIQSPPAYADLLCFYSILLVGEWERGRFCCS